jgi:hypothetical protein
MATHHRTMGVIGAPLYPGLFYSCLSRLSMENGRFTGSRYAHNGGDDDDDDGESP